MTFENDMYTLTAKVKNIGVFKNLEMYAQSGKKRYYVSVNEENKTWKTINIEGIDVKDNQVEIGFLAEGKAGAFCLVDDVSFVKRK